MNVTSKQDETMTDFDIYHYPKSRKATFDVGRIGRKKHHITGLLEIDVTDARKAVREKIKSGCRISFTAWLIKVISRTIADNPGVHAVNTRGRKQIVFKNVDMAMPVEKKVDGTKVPLAALIKKADKKTVEEISAEIQAWVSKDISGERDYVLDTDAGSSASAIFFNLPQFFRLFIWRIILSNPSRRKKYMGTVVFTNIGMAGRFPGWIIPKSMHNLVIGAGSIVKKPWVVKNQIVIREILHLSILFDHDVIDGAPAARFTDQLVKNIEKCAEL